MAIIAFVSQKGGVGKSTLSRALGREAAKSGLSVKIADLDPGQGTTTEWGRIRTAAGIEPVIPVQLYRATADAMVEADRHDLLIIDGPAKTSTATLDIAKAANLVVQPTGASRDDLVPAVREYHALVRKGIPKQRLRLALVRIGTDAEEADARAFLAEAGYDVLPGSLPERPAYRMAQNEGRAVTEVKFATLQKHAEALVQAIIDETVAASI
jgi:chromosome partitioning protein